MELLAKLATPLALYLAWAILSNSFFNQVLGFSLSLFLVLLISLIYYQPAPTEAYFLRVLVFSLAVFCVRLLPLVQWLLNSRSSNTRHREGLEVFPSERDDSERDEDSQRLFCADIIAVHGLGSNPDTTWQSRTTVPLEGSSDQEIYPIWLRDFLPQDLQKDGFRVRVMAFNHNTRWKTNALNKSLEDYGQDLLRELAEKRRSVEERSRPIIFIGHSFGGIIVKKALVIARNRGGDDFRCAIAGQTKGIIFMGTPHKGSRLTVFGRLLSVFGHFMGSSTHLLEVIQPSSAVNKDLHTSFLRGYDIKTMVCIFEAVRESFLGFPIMHVVGEDSAVIDGAEKIGLAKTHRELQRAASREDESYKTLRFWIRERVEQTWTNRQRKVHQVEPTEITQEEQECLRSLSFEEMNLRRNDVAPASYNTCAWVFDHESYSSWLSQRRGLLWIKGKPGAGKSTLIKYILRQGKFPDDLAIASFYFHGRGAPMQRTPIGLFRSVLHQILIQIRPLLSKFYLVFKKKLESEGVPGKDWVWHERELQDFLELAVTSASKSCSIRIFVDALDECGEKAARDLVSYFRYLTLKLPPTGSALSICFSCRHYPIVVLEHCLEICVEDRNYQDIKTYVREELGELQRGFPKDDVESLQEDIVNRSSGIFQWVSVIARQVLVLQQSGYSLNRIQKELQEKPTELNSLYQEMLKHMPGADRARSLQLMQWICFAERPLSLQELRFAMAFDADSPYRTLCQCQNSTAYIESDEQMKKLVKFLSGGLAEVKELGNRLAAQFIHQSVNDYLIQDGLQSLDNVSGSSVVGRGHHRLARSCIKYFATKEICHWSWEPVQLDNHYIYEFPFLRYAITFNGRLIISYNVGPACTIKSPLGPDSPMSDRPFYMSPQDTAS
ncbi:MAG: hypothetical protein M1813_008007 [Trichoglossum hirsutum]|nr:MAG: hypothetical protein M1813_008007 [Trichoglossum hirsutum]